MSGPRSVVKIKMVNFYVMCTLPQLKKKGGLKTHFLKVCFNPVLQPKVSKGMNELQK